MRFAEVSANVIIALVYLFIASYIGPRLGIRDWRLTYGGAGFFLTCALTHVHEAYHIQQGHGMSQADLTSGHMALIHLPQVVFVILFTWGIYSEFVVKARRDSTFLNLPEVKDEGSAE